jgi:hypothetical protein
VTHKFLTADSILGLNDEVLPFKITTSEYMRTLRQVADPRTGRIYFGLPKHSLNVIVFDREMWL